MKNLHLASCRGWWCVLLVLGAAALSSHRLGYAQTAVAAPASGGQVVAQDPFGAPQVIRIEGAMQPGMMPPGAKPEMPGAKPEEKKGGESKESKPGETKEDGKQEEKSATLKRPLTPPAPADPTELDIRPDASGRVRFNFRGQAWPDVLDWLATVAGMSLDWQELPGDYLNLTTQRTYTVAEARDLVNRHLLARGYTLLVVKESLTVVKTDGINAALVPRVEPAELASCLPHEYVKVSFPLEWLIAENAVEELKPMLSPNGKLTALKTTNRLEASDAAANLQELHAVLTREQSMTSQERLVREFVLQYVRATDASEQLKGLLGMATKSGGPQLPLSPQQLAQLQQQQQQMMAQMQQQQQQQQQQRGGRPGAPGAGGQDEVNLVVNLRRNSVLANAPPDKMAVIAKAIEVLDVPLDRDQSLLLNVNRMQVYRLAQLDPEALVKTLQDSGDLDPTTRLEVDRQNKAIIAYAALADHMLIRTLVQKLDGSGRQFEVLRLRRLEADYVSGTITFMMGQEPKTDERPRYYGFWDGRPRPADETSQDKFRVDADVAGNRLLLWANEIEMEEVRKLLVKLGEIPAEGGNPERVRVLDVDTGGGTRQLLEQIRQAWPALAPNPIVLPPAESLPQPARPAAGPRAGGAADDDPPAEPAGSRAPAQPQPPPAAVEAGRLPAPRLPPAALVRFAQLTADQVEPGAAVAGQADREDRPPDRSAEAETPQTSPPAPAAPPGNPAAAAPPVQIAVGPDGRLVISSQDTAALDLLEELLAQLAPPRKDFQIFPLKYASSLWVKLNLQDYFKEEPDDQNRRRNVFFFDYQQPAEKEKSYRLSQRKPLKFIDDVDTNTILVVGATAEQLQTIEELIRLWDAPPPSDTQSARLTAVFAVRYSKAEAIAETVKEVYLDLLSSNDKALQRNRDDKRPTNQTTYILGETSGEPDRRTQVSFKGKLSIGVDPLTNTLLVSTEGQTLMENVSKMIEALDEAAKPLSEVQVVTLQGNVNAERVRQVLTDMLGEKAIQTSPAAAAPAGGPQPGQPGWQPPAAGR